MRHLLSALLKARLGLLTMRLLCFAVYSNLLLVRVLGLAVSGCDLSEMLARGLLAFAGGAQLGSGLLALRDELVALAQGFGSLALQAGDVLVGQAQLGVHMIELRLQSLDLAVQARLRHSLLSDLLLFQPLRGVYRGCGLGRRS